MCRLTVYHRPDRRAAAPSPTQEPPSQARRYARHVAEKDQRLVDLRRQGGKRSGEAGGNPLAVFSGMDDTRARQGAAHDGGDPRTICTGDDEGPGDRRMARGDQRMGQQRATVERRQQLVGSAEATRRSRRQDNRDTHGSP